MFRHPLTDIGLEQFLKDWEKAQAGEGLVGRSDRRMDHSSISKSWSAARNWAAARIASAGSTKPAS